MAEEEPSAGAVMRRPMRVPARSPAVRAMRQAL